MDSAQPKSCVALVTTAFSRRMVCMLPYCMLT